MIELDLAARSCFHLAMADFIFLFRGEIESISRLVIDGSFGGSAALDLEIFLMLSALFLSLALDLSKGDATGLKCLVDP